MTAPNGSSDRARRAAVVVAFGLAALLHVSVAEAAPLLRGLGGPAGFGPGNLPGNDDSSSTEIDVRAAFPDGLHFFGLTFTSLYVNNNGNVTFGGSLGTFTPSPFPVASQRMIAPWWGDVDTRGAGFPTRNGVYWSITPGRFVATWHDVGYYSVHDDLRNAFQLILTRAGPGIGDFDVELRYERCEWTTGDASGGSGGFGGTPAQAGFDAGNLTDYVALPGSRTMEVLALCVTSNVEIPGVWRFEIRGGEVTCPGRGDACGTGLPGSCAAGTRVCRSAEESVCVANAEPRPELCNGVDDDCDRGTDEALPSSTCGIGECEVTTPSCIAGRPQPCVPGAPSTETCNRLDDDCDGMIDDMPELVCGAGACRATARACTAGTAGVCVPGPPSREVCNGVDDDCNDLVDDTLIDCMPPDAGPPDAGPPDAGLDGGLDGGPDVDAALEPDAGRCVRAPCGPRLSGRAGPIGRCSCRAGTRGGGDDAAACLALLALAIIARRRRR